MDYKQTYLRKWLIAHPCLSLSCLEKTCGIEYDLLRHVVKERRSIPDKHYDKLVEILHDYGFAERG